MSGVRAPSSGRAAGEAGVAHEMGRVGNQQVLEHAMDAGGRVGKLNAEAGPGAQPGPAPAVSPEVSPSTAPGAPLMETAPALGASLNGVKPQGAMGEEKSPFEASLLQQYQQVRLLSCFSVSVFSTPTTPISLFISLLLLKNPPTPSLSPLQPLTLRNANV